MKLSLTRLGLPLAGILLIMMVWSSAALASSPPTVETGSAVTVNQHEATLWGTIWPHTESESERVIYAFQYGTTTAYGSETESGSVPGGLLVSYSRSKLAKGLKANTTYHYRIGAYNEIGGGEIVYGKDKTFTTPPEATYQADAYPATLTGSQSTENGLVMKFENGLTASCKTASFGGTLSSASRHLVTTPSFSSCVVFGLSGKIEMRGCGYSFGAGEAAGDPASMSIFCAEEEAMLITTASCRVTIPVQSGLSGIVPTTEAGAPDKVKISLGVSGIKYEKVQDGFLCPLGGTGVKTDGAIEGTVSIGAVNASKSPIGLRIK